MHHGLLDLEQLGALSELDSEDSYLRRLCEQFTVDASRALEQMRNHLAQGDTTAFAREAHRLKGSSASIGAVGFSRGCQEIEHYARASHAAALVDGQAASQRIEWAQSQLDATVLALRAYIARAARRS